LEEVGLDDWGGMEIEDARFRRKLFCGETISVFMRKSFYEFILLQL
jgi:hypothetical protein